MKKAFVFILLAVITLSACRPIDTLDSTSKLEDVPDSTVIDIGNLSDEHQGGSETELVLLVPADVLQDDTSETEHTSMDHSSTTSVSVSDSQKAVMPEPTTPELEVTVPVETKPIATEPVETELEVTQSPSPETAESVPAEPITTEPELVLIDSAALEAYGRSYASNTYGYNGTSACNPSTGAGYFPGATKEILTMEEGYRLVQQAIDSQYRRDIAYGYSPFEEIDGVIVRCPINIGVEATGQPNVYVIWVYYGGSA